MSNGIAVDGINPAFTKALQFKAFQSPYAIGFDSVEEIPSQDVTPLTEEDKHLGQTAL